VKPANRRENRRDRRLRQYRSGKRRVVVVIRERNGRRSRSRSQADARSFLHGPVRLSLQAVENRVRLSEPVLTVSVSFYVNPPSAGPEAVRRGRGSLEHLNLTVAIGTVRFPLSKAIEPRICWQTIFICGNHRSNSASSRRNHRYHSNSLDDLRDRRIPSAELYDRGTRRRHRRKVGCCFLSMWCCRA
jgi:hypothetical protein